MTTKDTDKWITALIGIVSGLGVKIIDRFINKKKDTAWDEAERIRNEQRLELDDLHKQLEEVSELRDNYYIKVEENIKLKSERDEFEKKLKNLDEKILPK